MIELIRKCRETEAPSYLERIDKLRKLEIVRLKGKIDQTTIPVIESRIQENRKKGSKIDKNIILDFSKVEHVDSATIAFHMIHLKEYQERGFVIGFINITKELKLLLEIFKKSTAFTIFASEAEAVKALNR